MEECNYFYSGITTISNTVFADSDNPTFKYGFAPTSFMIMIDKGENVGWSWNAGNSLHGELLKADKFITHD